jgi:hypothetical protein
MYRVECFNKSVTFVRIVRFFTKRRDSFSNYSTSLFQFLAQVQGIKFAGSVNYCFLPGVFVHVGRISEVEDLVESLDL